MTGYSNPFHAAQDNRGTFRHQFQAKKLTNDFSNNNIQADLSPQKKAEQKLDNAI